jgi:hypothetical protein
MDGTLTGIRIIHAREQSLEIDDIQRGVAHPKHSVTPPKTGTAPAGSPRDNG